MALEKHYPAQLISELVGLIYDCVLDSDRWSSTNDRIRAELGFSYAVLGVYPLRAGEIELDRMIGRCLWPAPGVS